MSTHTTTPTFISETKRPVGVWISTIWAGLFAGLFPVGLVLFFYFGPAKGSEMMSGFRLLLSLSLGVGIVASAIGAWRGFSVARYALVILVAVHCLLIAYQNYQMAAAGVEVRGSATILWGRVIRSLVTATVIGGYLLFAPRARAFFSRRHNVV